MFLALHRQGPKGTSFCRTPQYWNTVRQNKGLKPFSPKGGDPIAASKLSAFSWQAILRNFTKNFRIWSTKKNIFFCANIAFFCINIQANGWEPQAKWNIYFVTKYSILSANNGIRTRVFRATICNFNPWVISAPIYEWDTRYRIRTDIPLETDFESAVFAVPPSESWLLLGIDVESAAVAPPFLYSSSTIDEIMKIIKDHLSMRLRRPGTQNQKSKATLRGTSRVGQFLFPCVA